MKRLLFPLSLCFCAVALGLAGYAAVHLRVGFMEAADGMAAAAALCIAVHNRLTGGP